MLSLLPYHIAVTDYLRKQDQVWRFFASRSYMAEQLRAWKTDLLKTTYKFNPDVETALYALLETARQKLGLDIPVTLYQQEGSEDSNASIAYVDNEAHIVFSGKILRDLDEPEQLAIIAHELSHVLLFRQLNGDVEVADSIITALGNNRGSGPAHYETARLFKLYTEIFCDRGALLVHNSYGPIISALVKIATGLSSVNPDSYLRQAEEIFSNEDDTKTRGISHPENFIRARALRLWREKGPDAENEIRKMIEGHLGLAELDLFKQLEMQSVTRRMIDRLLAPSWMQTERNINLANNYFPNVYNAGKISASADDKHQQSPGDNHQQSPGATISITANLHKELKEYLAYVLYDFSTADKELEDLTLAHCFRLAQATGLSDTFLQTVRKEQKLTEKKTLALRDRLLAQKNIA